MIGIVVKMGWERELPLRWLFRAPLRWRVVGIARQGLRRVYREGSIQEWQSYYHIQYPWRRQVRDNSLASPRKSPRRFSPRQCAFSRILSPLHLSLRPIFRRKLKPQTPSLQLRLIFLLLEALREKKKIQFSLFNINVKNEKKKTSITDDGIIPVTICSSGNLPLFCLNIKSPRARERARWPLTRFSSTQPPAASIRSHSSSSVGLWSLLSGIHWPPTLATDLLSPALP